MPAAENAGALRPVGGGLSIRPANRREHRSAPVPLALEPYLGEVILFAGNYAPRGWAFAEGQLLPIAQHQSLFAILGTVYGGDGRTTFALPDTRGDEPACMHYIIALQGVFPSRN
jgi:microcystin-dependent protein